MRRYKTCLRSTALWLAAVLLAGCAPAGEKQAEQAAPETTASTVVTIMHSETLDNFVELASKALPDIRLEFERIPYPGELLRRLENGAGPDLAVFPQISKQEMEAYLLDISDIKASTLYDGSVMQPLRKDGLTYLLPLPGEYRGYIINETLFEEAGLSVPDSNQALYESLVALKEQGLGLGEDGANFCMLSLYNTDVGMFYMGYMVPDFLG
ncbi:MAG: extracellular solute-binding protein, partial [Clostridia bacterium]|nr:extracellular solute-binding protein [Clostridia bacterium]